MCIHRCIVVYDLHLSIYWALAPPGIPGQVAQRTGFWAPPWGFQLSVFVFSMKKYYFEANNRFSYFF